MGWRCLPPPHQPQGQFHFPSGFRHGVRLTWPVGVSEGHMTSGGQPVETGTIPKSPPASLPWQLRILGGSTSERKMGALSLGVLGLFVTLV